MYIQPISSNSPTMTSNPRKPSGWSRFTQRIKKEIFDALPEVTIKSKDKSKYWKAIDDTLSKPAENRAIMGATALISQPWIDSKNKNVDENTRKISRNRTIAKIIAGTLVGIGVRGSCYKLVEKMTDVVGGGKFSKSLLPAKYLMEIKLNPKFLKNYRSALSTSLAILVMCITNFLIDAPLTVYLTNKMNKNLKNESNTKTSLKEKNGLEVKYG